MAKTINNFRYEVTHGHVTGAFNIYQAVNGSIQLLMGNCNTALTWVQIKDLSLDVYELVDFDHECFKKYYKLT